MKIGIAGIIGNRILQKLAVATFFLLEVAAQESVMRDVDSQAAVRQIGLHLLMNAANVAHSTR